MRVVFKRKKCSFTNEPALLAVMDYGKNYRRVIVMRPHTFSRKNMQARIRAQSKAHINTRTHTAINPLKEQTISVTWQQNKQKLAPQAAKLRSENPKSKSGRIQSSKAG